MKIDQTIKEDLKEYFKDRMKQVKEKVIITSAYELSNEEEKTIISSLGLTGGKIEYKVDRTLLAGVIVTYGSKIIDVSLKGQLQNFKHILYESA
jgi:ATP synthase F1 delta subunit